jgi:hypothetical protein
MHDLWTLRGIGVRPESFPRILGCDIAGWDASCLRIAKVIEQCRWRAARAGDRTLCVGAVERDGDAYRRNQSASFPSRKSAIMDVDAPESALSAQGR